MSDTELDVGTYGGFVRLIKSNNGLFKRYIL